MVAAGNVIAKVAFKGMHRRGITADGRDAPARLAQGQCAVWEHGRVTAADEGRRVLVRRGFTLEYLTLGWNVAGIVVLGFAAVAARSVALAGFGLDSLIEIGASTVVIWELSGSGEQRQRTALRLIGAAFALLAVYLAVQSTAVLVTGYRPHHSSLGIAWTAITAAVMFALAAGKAATGTALGTRYCAPRAGLPPLTGYWRSRCWQGWRSTRAWAGGRLTRWPGTCSSSTLPARSGISIPSVTDRARRRPHPPRGRPDAAAGTDRPSEPSKLP